MADREGTPIDWTERDARAENWRDLPDGLALLTPPEVQWVRALLAAERPSRLLARLAVGAQELEACCVHGAPTALVERVRRKLGETCT